MHGALSEHPVAKLFPQMSSSDFSALVEDIRLHGVKVPILVHGGQILDGRHRYKACQQLGLVCPTVEWNGWDPWLEVQSRNLVRRHLTKEQICAIHVLARKRFPELVVPIDAAKDHARQRKAQAKNQPRGTKAAMGPGDPRRTADVVGSMLGVSGTTVKRVDRLARLAPELMQKVAGGQLSVKKALREAEARPAKAAITSNPLIANDEAKAFQPEVERSRLQRLLRGEWARWPARQRAAFLYALDQLLQEFVNEHNHSRILATAADFTDVGTQRPRSPQRSDFGASPKQQNAKGPVDFSAISARVAFELADPPSLNIVSPDRDDDEELGEAGRRPVSRTH